jgi:hypothetical protein
MAFGPPSLGTNPSSALVGSGPPGNALRASDDIRIADRSRAARSRFTAASAERHAMA